MHSAPFSIRKGTPDDLPQTLELIKELALYERAPDEVTNTLERMHEDGFGKDPIYEFYVAIQNDQIVGLSIFYYRYSTWKGRCLYLEDLIVTEKMRAKGIGKSLFDQTFEHAKQKNCVSMNWQVLDWNEPAINFYKKYPTNFDGEWVNVTIKCQ